MFERSKFGLSFDVFFSIPSNFDSFDVCKAFDIHRLKYCFSLTFLVTNKFVSLLFKNIFVFVLLYINIMFCV